MNNPKDIPQNYNGTTIIRVVCAIVFFVFTFSYLYFYQADILSVGQHVLSGGKTTYDRTIGAILITITLYLLHLLVFAVTRLYRHWHALTYFPSLLALTALTSVHSHFDTNHSFTTWYVVGFLLLVLFGFISWLCYKNQKYESGNYDMALFSNTMSVNMFTMFFMMMAVGLISNHEEVFHYRAHIESQLDKGNLIEASETGKYSEATDSSLVMLRAYALAQQGLLGERLFEYPLIGGSHSLMPNGITVKSIVYPEVEIKRFASGKASDDYRLCAYLLDKDLESFAKSVVKCYHLDNPALPKHYREALTLYAHRRENPIVRYQDERLDSVYQVFVNMERLIEKDNSQYALMRDQFGNTYWHYYLYGKK